ncbi:MAG: ABC transporter ATP-binding protein [Candidatus Bathyarchaeia archaeon]
MLNVEDLKKYFLIKRGILAKPSYIKAVDGISFYVNKSETLGLVGESGSGKTTVGLLVLRLIDPTSGKIFFDGVNIAEKSQKELMKFRKRMSIVFQDPLSSLNPRMTVKETLKRPLITHGIKIDEERTARIIEILKMVGLGEEHLGRYPHELSGGQQQRVAVARAIILNPDLVVLDEPTSSLDVSVQAQILNLLLKLQRELNLTYLFITHDLVTVRHVSDRIAVMYLGKIVEVAETDELFSNTMHPYTAALLSAAPIPKPEAKNVERFVVSGEPPSPINPPTGCRFHPRCRYATEKCLKEEPQLIDVGKNHTVACHRAKEIDISSYARKLWEILMAKT